MTLKAFEDPENRSPHNAIVGGRDLFIFHYNTVSVDLLAGFTGL
jgi:hypothetical protein